MWNGVLIAFIAGLALADLQDNDLREDTPDDKFNVTAINECFKTLGADLDAEMLDQEKCWRELKDRSDWQTDFCDARKRGEKGTNPCKDKPFFGHFEECIDENSYTDIMNGFMQEIQDKYC